MAFAWFSTTIQHIALGMAFVLVLAAYAMTRHERKKAQWHYGEAVRLHREAAEYYRKAQRLSAEDRAVFEEWTQ